VLREIGQQQKEAVRSPLGDMDLNQTNPTRRAHEGPQLPDDPLSVFNPEGALLFNIK
jgi:hypothetical protein